MAEDQRLEVGVTAVDAVLAELGLEGRSALRDRAWVDRRKIPLHEAMKGIAQLRAANLVCMIEERAGRRKNGRQRRRKFYRLTGLGSRVREALFELDRAERATRLRGFTGPVTFGGDIRIVLPYTNLGSPPVAHTHPPNVYFHACPGCRALGKG